MSPACTFTVDSVDFYDTIKIVTETREYLHSLDWQKTETAVLLCLLTVQHLGWDLLAV